MWSGDADKGSGQGEREWDRKVRWMGRWNVETGLLGEGGAESTIGLISPGRD